MNELPIHFFTIVLNGKPFIPYHIEIFKQLDINWHWHIIEGVANLKHDTAWSLELGGKIPENIHKNGLSKDGTSEYLEKIEQEFPENITIYRKPEDCFWDGKCEMVNAPLQFIKEEVLLWQIDSDELWTKEQIEKMHQMYQKNPDKTAGYFWCWYFVSPELVISSRNCYAQNPNVEWLRTFRFTPGCKWQAHEPPILVNANNQDVSKINPFTHKETELENLIFEHYSYTTKEQLEFKENYYGYNGALKNWANLQKQDNFPILLREHFDWIKDSSLAEPYYKLGLEPIAKINKKSGEWEFLISSNHENRLDKTIPNKKIENKYNQNGPIVIDGVFFQLAKTGIARMWTNILKEWSKSDFSNRIVFLERENSGPNIPNIKTIKIKAYQTENFNKEREYLESICCELNASLFISTYYTSTITTPCLQLVYDMIPEKCNFDLSEHCWTEKNEAFLNASYFVSISENTKHDLHELYPNIDYKLSKTCLLASEKETFYPATSEEISNFHNKFNIDKPYFLLVGPNNIYKNGSMIFEAFQKLTSQCGFAVIIIGGSLSQENVEKFQSGVEVLKINANDDELRVAYSGAISLVYPSAYEGFGLPILEAMQCLCPVITTPFTSIPEVAGDAVLYIKNADELSDALCEVQKPNIQNKLRLAGIKQAQKFSWVNTAENLKNHIIHAISLNQEQGEDKENVDNRYY